MDAVQPGDALRRRPQKRRRWPSRLLMAVGAGMVITGIVRPADVWPNNVVSSVSIANATVQFDGKGTVGDVQHKGILSKLFGWLF